MDLDLLSITFISIANLGGATEHGTTWKKDFFCNL